MPVLQHKKSFDGSTDLFCRRDHGIGKDVLIDPGIGSLLRDIGADGVEQEKAVLFQEAADFFHECSIILIAHMFKHAQ